MPVGGVYLGLSNERTNEVRAQRQASDDAFKMAAKLSEQNWKYYLGEHHNPLKDEEAVVIINLCRQALDRTVSFLFPEMPTLEISDTETTDEEIWLREAWKANGDVTFLTNAALFGAVNGQVYVKVVETGGFPRLLLLDGAKVVPFYDADDKDTVQWYEIRWKAGKTDMRQDVVWVDGQWMFYEFKRVGSEWEFIEEIVWPYNFCPIVSWQHLPNPKAHIGSHEFQHAKLNDAVNKVMSDIMQILRFHASPRTIGTGFEADAVQSTGIDDFWTIGNEDAKVFNLEMQSDLAASMNTFETLRNAFFSESRVVMMPSDLGMFRSVTNLGIRAMFSDMIKKNDVLRRSYGQGIIEISKAMWMMVFNSDIQVNVEWPSALPSDKREEVTLIQQQIGMGIMSKQTAAGRLGLDYRREDEQIADELLSDPTAGGFAVGNLPFDSLS